MPVLWRIAASCSRNLEELAHEVVDQLVFCRKALEIIMNLS